MLKYKDTYKIGKNKDKLGNIANKDDNFIKCVPAKANIQIYRFSEDILVVQFNSTGIANNRVKELSAMGVQLTTLQCGDNESTYIFKESDFNKVAEVVKAKKKKVISDEQKEILSLRMKNIVHNKMI